MKYLYLFLALTIILLQARLLSSEGGVSELFSLQKQLQKIEVELAQQQALNESLTQQVSALQTQTESLESLARQSLGMIKRDEVFVEVIELPIRPVQVQPQSDTLVNEAVDSES